MSDTTGYRPDIDGLRAFSIIAVLVYHAFPDWLPGGFVGVDVFFVISGYLISGIILRESAAGSFSLAHFYRRRVQRIFPATALVLAVTMLAGWWVLLPYEYAQLGKHTAASAGFVPNLVYWTEAGYFDTDSKLKPLLHFWSLGVEEQFYLVWPALLLLALRLRQALPLILALLLLSFASGLLAADRASAFFLPWNRVWELLAGAALAALPASRTPAAAGRTAQHLCSLAGLALMVTATIVIDSAAAFPRWWALLPVLGAATMLAAGPAGIANRLLANPLLVLVGKISFPLYLWHWPLLTFARIMYSGEPPATVRGAAVALAVLLAAFTWRILERPLRYHRARRVPALLLGAMLLVALAGLVIWRLDGVPARTTQFNASAQTLYWKELGLHERDDCSDRLSVPGRCLSDGKSPQVAVLGDSHSSNVFFALAHYYRDTPTGVIRLGVGGCPPLYDVSVRDAGAPDTCRAATAGNLDWVLANPQIETVYLSSMGPMYLSQRGRYQLQDPAAPALDSNRKVFARALAATVDRLQAAGKQVVLVLDWPGLGFDPATCVDLRPLRLAPFTPRECRTPAARHQRREAAYRRILETVAAQRPGVMLWDTPAVFCDADFCTGMHDGVLLYRDPGHLSLPGSRYLGEHLQLTRPAAD
ncbi:acyltransferase family protein [Mangrovimicrobium sediminis]|uniref:acyltransferase family protein n=1 Tax=Mangrovimicrobium sediminis TaxID=2562682 RepID=UPI0014369F72|nr:acyltransferase family protein [Haliea sp. SAOS-164]